MFSGLKDEMCPEIKDIMKTLRANPDPLFTGKIFSINILHYA